MIKKNTKKHFFALCGFYHLGSLGIYFDKMNPKLKKKLTRSAPLGALTVILLGFVSDWTSDSHFTHYLSSKMKSFWCGPKLQRSVRIHNIYISQFNCNQQIVN